jgi:hypothetical protein
LFQQSAVERSANLVLGVVALEWLAHGKQNDYQNLSHISLDSP